MITIVNKLKKADTKDKATDELVVAKITGEKYREKTVRSVSNSTVSIGQSIILLIPFGKGYLPYSEWKSDTSKGFTMQTGDTIFFEDIAEEITIKTISSLKANHNSMTVKSVVVAEDNGIATVQLQIEGV